MSHKRQFGIWIGAAVVTVIVFLLVLRAQYQPTQARFALAVNAHPSAGRTVFETKGCARCHGTDGSGSEAGPSLRNRAALTSLPRLVTALWNHVPRMADAMQAGHMPYPTMTNDEAAQLASYLFVTGLTDNPGDPARGAEIFAARRCASCHREGGDAPPPAELGVATSPIAFSETLWNHASAMQTQMRRRSIDWPKLDASDIRDLLSFVQSRSARPHAAETRVADAARGWELFQSKSCMDCHALSGRETSTPRLTSRSAPAPPLPGWTVENNVPPTLSQFAAAMLNHFPNMNRAMNDGGAPPPQFVGGDLEDLAVFLYSLHNTEPAGSPYVGASIFVWRGCAECHGQDASGGSAPALRGRGQSYTAVRLATGLWAHGNRMYDETRRRGQPWPRLEDSDIGDLLAFLNTPPEKKSDAPPESATAKK